MTTSLAAGDDSVSPRRAIHLDCAAILFDLDGVLVNSAELVERTWRRWAREHDLDAERVLEMAHGRRTQETVALVAPHLSAEAEGAALAATEETATEGIYEIAGALELVRGLPGRHWAIVTSGTRAVATQRIRHTGLPLPEVLVTADDVERGKPDPQGYVAAAQRLGAPARDCIVIEDAPPGIEAARAAGMRCIGVAGTYAAELLRMADHVIPDLRALHVVARVRGLRIELASVA